MRIGIGYDVHRLVKGRELILGGVKVDYHLGLEGHSDADVLSHAVMDALLGAASLGDIGQLFPPGEPLYRGADSLKLLEQVAVKLRNEGFVIVNVDSVICAQAPKLLPYREQMKLNLAGSMKVEVNCVGVKATTTEGLGFQGRGEGIAAQAVALIKSFEQAEL